MGFGIRVVFVLEIFRGDLDFSWGKEILRNIEL